MTAPRPDPPAMTDSRRAEIETAKCSYGPQAYREISDLLAEVDRLKGELVAARTKLEGIVCTVPPDDGVVLLSSDGPTRPPTPEERARGYDCPIYVHKHFSPLGDALMELWRMLQ